MTIVISEKIENKYKTDSFQIKKNGHFTIINSKEINCYIDEESKTLIVNAHEKLCYNTKIFLIVINELAINEGMEDIVINYNTKNKELIENFIQELDIKPSEIEKGENTNSFSYPTTQYESLVEIKEIKEKDLKEQDIKCAKCSKGRVEKKTNNNYPELGFEYYMCNNCDYRKSSWKKITGENKVTLQNH